jgi:ribosomal protein L7/L12
MFEKLFLLLFPYVTYSQDTHSLILNITDLIESERTDAVKEARAVNATLQSSHDAQVHELLVVICLTNDLILDAIYINQKITAIKELRRIVGFPNASLRQTKFAVQDSRVFAKAQDSHNGWVTDIQTDPELADAQANHQQDVTTTPDCEQ